MEKKWQGIWRIILSLALGFTWFVLPVGSSTVMAADNNWSAPMTAATNTEGSNPNLAFGVAPTATDSLDSGIDIPHSPPAPGATFDAYFQIVHVMFSQLDKDFRAQAASIQWTLKANSQSESITLTWDASSVPANLSLRLTKTGLDVDMKAASSTVLAAGAHTLTITATVMSPPAVTSNAATDITLNSATLNGNLTGLGDYSSANVSFEWGTTSGNLSQTTAPQAKSSTGTFSAAIGSLTAGTTYYFRAKAVSNPTVYGDILNFTTLTTQPAVTTIGAASIGASVATLRGSLDSTGSAADVDVSFMWGTSSGSLTNETAAVSLGAPGLLSVKVEGLTENTPYYFKAKAVGDGTVYGSEMSFATLTSGCFIATAAYGSYLDSHVDTLRDFRDEYLMASSIGQSFVTFYYRHSPPIAQFISEHEYLKPVVRALLMPAVWMSNIALAITLPMAAAITGLLAIGTGIVIMWMRNRRQRPA